MPSAIRGHDGEPASMLHLWLSRTLKDTVRIVTALWHLHHEYNLFTSRVYKGHVITAISGMRLSILSGYFSMSSSSRAGRVGTNGRSGGERSGE